jgi:hypothetical protein
MRRAEIKRRRKRLWRLVSLLTGTPVSPATIRRGRGLDAVSGSAPAGKYRSRLMRELATVAYSLHRDRLEP